MSWLFLALVGCVPEPGALPDTLSDDDGDGLSEVDGDCDDTNADAYPDAVWTVDADDDGATVTLTQCDVPAGVTDAPSTEADCDDADPASYPGKVWAVDADGDGATVPVDQCADPGNALPAASAEADCDDADPALYPDAIWYVDADHDGATVPITQCEIPADALPAASAEADCDDTDPAQVPGAVWYVDDDGDGYTAPLARCARPADPLTPGAEDCDDTDPARNRAGPWFTDLDGDGWGGAALPDCQPADGLALVGGDCSDYDPITHPGAPEDCGPIDLDCDVSTEASCVISGEFLGDYGDAYTQPLAQTPRANHTELLLGDWEVANPTWEDAAATDGELVASWIDPATGDRADFTLEGAADYTGLTWWPTPDLDGDGEEELFLLYGDYDHDTGLLWKIEDLTADTLLEPDDALRTLPSQSYTVAAGGELLAQAGRELAVGRPDNTPLGGDAVVVYANWSGTPSALVTLTAPITYTFGRDLVVAELNGDAWDDLAVTGTNWSGDGCLWIYAGPLVGATFGAPTAELCEIGAGPPSVELAGDLNGDGGAWLWVSAPGRGVPPLVSPGHLWAVDGQNIGSYTGFDTALTRQVTSDLVVLDGLGLDHLFGGSLGVAGDQSGDGVADPIVGAPSWDGNLSYDLLYDGDGPSYLLDSRSISRSPDLPLSSPGLVQAMISNAVTVRSAGDVDGDGAGDLWHGNDEYVWLLYGGITR